MTPTLHMLCGKIASGKSTLASELGRARDTVVVSEDEWLGALFSDQLKTGSDYVRCAAKLQTAMGPHISALLRAGLSVVLDFPANTLEQRTWMRRVVDASGVPNQLHYFDTPDEVCLKRLRARNEQGEHAFAATEEQFHRFAAHFVPPSDAEGFTIVRH